MPRNEDGEMELVLGNKQLLSVLFILVVLLGVFFTMGYIVGRNNPSEDKVRIAAAKQNQAAAARMPPFTVEPGSGEVTPQKPSPTTPRQTDPLTVEPTNTETKKTDTPKTEKQESAKKQEEPNEPPPAGLFQPNPAPGLYLQVAASDRAGSTGMAEAYRKQGFAAVITSSSSPTLFRVLIGPLKNTDDMADVKLKLKKLGVDGAFPRKF